MTAGHTALQIDAEQSLLAADSESANVNRATDGAAELAKPILGLGPISEPEPELEPDPEPEPERGANLVPGALTAGWSVYLPARWALLRVTYRAA
eukprot:SAG31_NODE_11799_length_997_cov_1.243875_1_plen_94_part_10